PLSVEKLCPVLSFYVVRDWHEACDRCKQILRYGGMGHTMSIHSQNDQVILEFGLKKPAFRILVNTPTTLGSIGLTTGLDPALTLGCGGYGGNITSDNISPRHLLNIKRLAYELVPAARALGRGAGPAAASDAPGRQAPPKTGISADALTRQIDQFLGARGYDGGAAARAVSAPPVLAAVARPADGPGPAASPTPPAAAPLTFVCEDDVRRAIQAGQKLVVAERAIVTPAARDLADAHHVLSVAGWSG
ncbi:MAG: hypothetical protein ABUS56_06020, partial [Acidobacteriota bacterium]